MKKHKLFLLTVVSAFVAVPGAWASFTFPGMDSSNPIHCVQAISQNASKDDGKDTLRLSDGKSSELFSSFAMPEASGGDNAGILADKPSKDRAKSGPFAPEAAKQSETSSPSRFNVWRSIGAMMFVLGALLAVHAFIRKRAGWSSRTSGQRRIKILEKLAIDARRSFFLLEVNGKEILVGVGTERIEFLTDAGGGAEKSKHDDQET